MENKYLLAVLSVLAVTVPCLSDAHSEISPPGAGTTAVADQSDPVILENEVQAGASRIEAEVAALLEAKKYQEIEKLARLLRLSKERDLRGDWKLLNVYTGLAQLPKSASDEQ